ncbi:unnamed protein product [Rotaria magnacalcarata]|uniref:Protein kinase domain-containing protein n=1 Tax=Rotaria magnacalcarata TaxID=392030 RepID=A0A8S2PL04_9BILA|nr:unnamed protein product [Rotaria magnacalcarata]
MANGTKKLTSRVSSRQIPHIRLYDDGNLETRYELLDKLGEGSFGTVCRVKNKENDLFFAMKTITKKPGNKLKASSLDNEVKLLTEVNHTNLIQLYEVLESSQKLYLIVELCEGGELGGYVKKNGPLPEETVKQIMSNLISALHYLHKMNIVHRDLKICGRHPYVASDERRLLEIIRSQKLRFDSDKFRNISSEGLDFLQGMIVYDTVHRRTMGELTVHPWLTGRSDKEPAKDIITMMKEFQAENDQRQTSIDNNLAALINATADHMNESQISNEQSKFVSSSIAHKLESFNSDSTQSKSSLNPPDLCSAVDKNKLNSRTTHRSSTDALKTFRSNTHDINGNSSKLQIRSKKVDMTKDLIDSNQSRQTFNSSSFLSSSTTSSKIRPGNVRLGRSQSQAEIVLSSKYSSPRQQQYRRTILNDSINIGVTPSSDVLNPPSNSSTIANLPNSPPSSTATALMMINKHYSNSPSSSSLPTMSRDQHDNTKKISSYDKRPSNDL